MICRAVQRLHQLAWQPGLSMATEWWEALEMKKWQTIYHSYPSNRSAIDQAIMERRGFPQPGFGASRLPLMLDCNEQKLFQNEARLINFAAVLGLIALGEREALCVGASRRVLASLFSLSACDQLLSMNLVWGMQAGVQQSQKWDGENLSQLIQVGCQWLFTERQHSALNALLIILPVDKYTIVSSKQAPGDERMIGAVNKRSTINKAEQAILPPNNLAFPSSPLPLLYKLMRFL